MEGGRWLRGTPDRAGPSPCGAPPAQWRRFPEPLVGVRLRSIAGDTVGWGRQTLASCSPEGEVLERRCLENDCWGEGAGTPLPDHLPPGSSQERDAHEGIGSSRDWASPASQCVPFHPAPAPLSPPPGVQRPLYKHRSERGWGLNPGPAFTVTCFSSQAGNASFIHGSGGMRLPTRPFSQRPLPCLS